MKKAIQLFLLLFLMSVNGNAQIVSVSIFPENPTELDSIFLINHLSISTHWAVPFDNEDLSYEMNEQDNLISLIYTYIGAQGAGSFESNNYLDTVFLGQFNSGSYSLFYQFQSLVLEDDY